MVRKLFDVGIVIAVIWAVGKFLITPFVAVTISQPACVTAVICVSIAICGIIIPILLQKK